MKKGVGFSYVVKFFAKKYELIPPIFTTGKEKKMGWWKESIDIVKENDHRSW